MLTPLIALVLGTTILVYAVLAYLGSPWLKGIPIASKHRGNGLLAMGNWMVGLALILGIVGYFSPLNGTWLRFLRIIVGATGLVLIGEEVHKSRVLNYWFKDLRLGWGAFCQQAHRYSELLHVLVARNLKVRYRGSFLGVYWSLLSPLIMTGLYTAIFGATFASYYNNSIANYVLAAFTGLVIINFFSASTSQALSSVVGNGALLNKIRLPVSVFPTSMIAANVFHFSVGALPLLAIVTIVRSHSIVNVLALVFPLLALTLVCAGVGFLISGLYVFFRDLPYFYELVVFILSIGTPIFYPAAIVPEKVKPFLNLNPLSPIIESIRQISLSGNMPDLSLIAGSLLTGVIVLTMGWVCFHGWRSQFMDLL